VADEKKGGKSDNQMKEDEILRRLAAAPGEAPAGVISFTGLLGRSPQEGYWRLYLSLDMSRYIEVSGDDVVLSEPLPPDRSPFGSLGGTRLFIKKNANVTTTRSVSRSGEAQAAADEFDLDVRLGGAGVAPKEICFGTESGTTCAAECGGQGTGDAATCLTCVSCGDTCFRTCRTCRTDCGLTCDTCNKTCQTCKTQCGQATCQTCQTHCGTCQTCRTNCGTCQTCQTQCGTCQTQCGQATCQTCRTDCGTCPGDTCAACTHVTCFRTCDIC
jgi:hypothetical protein